MLFLWLVLCTYIIHIIHKLLHHATGVSTRATTTSTAASWLHQQEQGCYYCHCYSLGCTNRSNTAATTKTTATAATAPTTAKTTG